MSGEDGLGFREGVVLAKKIDFLLAAFQNWCERGAVADDKLRGNDEGALRAL